MILSAAASGFRDIPAQLADYGRSVSTDAPVVQSEAAQRRAANPVERGAGPEERGQGARYHGGSVTRSVRQREPLTHTYTHSLHTLHTLFTPAPQRPAHRQHGHEEEDHLRAAEPEPGGGESVFTVSPRTPVTWSRRTERGARTLHPHTPAL